VGSRGVGGLSGAGRLVGTDGPTGIPGVLGVGIGAPVVLGRGLEDRGAVVPGGGDGPVRAGAVGRLDVGWPRRCCSGRLRGRALGGAAGVVEGVTASNATASGEGRLGSVGLVVGATVGEAVCRLGIDLLRANGPLLAPGIGAQGAGPAELESVFGSARRHVLASTSRGVLKAGPSIEALRTAALAATHEAAAALR